MEPEAVRQLWGLSGAPSRGPRPRVSLAEIARAAVAEADEAGFDAVTLATVAAGLGLTTSALYRYVDAKDTLVELMVDAALGPAPEAQSISGWVDALWARYAAHPWLATYPLVRAPRCPNAFDWLAQAVGVLTRDGVRDPLAVAMSIDVLVRGYAGLVQAAAVSTLSPELLAEIARRHPAIVAVQSLPEPYDQVQSLVADVVRQASKPREG